MSAIITDKQVSIKTISCCCFSYTYNMQDSNSNNKETLSFLDKTLASRRDHYLTRLNEERCIIINSFRGLDDKNHTSLVILLPYLPLIFTYLLTLPTQIHAVHQHLCLEDDYTNDLPIFIEKRTICNYDTVPVLVYPIKITPDTDYETKLCLKG